MVMFSSRPPFNDDPKPYVTYADDRRTDVRSKEWDIQSDGATEYVRVFDPRPELDRPRYNPTNPILTKFREIPEGSREPWRTGFLNAAKHQRFAAWSGDEVEHAVRVLSRVGASDDVG